MKNSINDSAQPPASEAGVFLWMIWQAMQRMGLDTSAVLASINLPDAPPDPQARRDNAGQRRFWQALEQISGDTDIGLHVGEMMPPLRGHLLEYLLLSSPTLGDGIQRVLACSSLLSDSFQLRLEVESDTARLVGFSHPVRHFIECTLVVVLKLLGQVTDGEFRASVIWLEQQQGAAAAEYLRVYACPVELGQPQTAICFDAALLNRVSAAAAPQLLQLHEQLAHTQLQGLQQREWLARLEQEILALLAGGKLTLALLAGALGMSQRRLRTELSLAGTSFNEQVAACRARLARRLLAQTDEPLDQIIYRTGFSEAAAFSRAFKRWSGETPTDYRRRRRRP